MAEITAQMVKDLREKSGAGMMDCKKALGESAGDMEKAMLLLRERGAAIASKRSSRAAKEGLVAAWISADRKSAGMIELNCESDFVARNDDFQALCRELARHAGQIADPSGLMESKMASGTSVADTVQAAIGRIGENIVLSRWEKVAATADPLPGLVYVYIHPPGKIGVAVEVGCGKDGLAADAAMEEFGADIAMHIAASMPICVDRTQVPADLVAQERELFKRQALNEGKPEKIVEKIVDGRIQKYYAEVALLEQAFAKNPDIRVEEYVKQTATKVGTDLSVKRFVRFKLGETVEAEASAA